MNSYEPVSTFVKRPFCLDNLSYVILSKLEVNNITYLQLLQGADIPLLSRQSGSVSVGLHGR